jgi:hypothetical protein
MRIFPLHPLPLTLAAFFITSLGTILIEYGPELPPEAPKWFFKVYSVMITLVAAFYALFAAMKTAENLFFRTAPRSPSRARRLSDRLLSPAPLTPAQTVGIALISYLLTIYAFALIYQSLGAGEPTPFNTKLDLGSSLYFSIVTIATVGYGDILATRSFARAMVSLEILIGIAYHVFFFSIIAGLIRREPTKASKPISHRRFGIPSVRGRRSRG